MNDSSGGIAGALHLRLPATSANLGPGFDAAAVALNFYLEIEARAAAKFSIVATGRDVDRCCELENNLVVDVYSRLLEENGRAVVPLELRMQNSIPLGMGCGSSAASRLAAIALAVHFGQLGWGSKRILEEASALEGHPDNAVACWLGGFVVAASTGKIIHAARAIPPAEWRAIIAIPSTPLATSKARAVLPCSYSSEDAVANIQATSLLAMAFAQGRGDLLQIAMRDQIHQPYRATICPLLPRLLPLAGKEGVLGVALSGAGPAVLVIVEDEQHIEKASQAIRGATQDAGESELLVCRFESSGVEQQLACAAIQSES